MMKRPEFLVLAVVAAMLGLPLRAQLQNKLPQSVSKKPNVLYILLEDIGPQLACYGEPLVRTPNLDRFATQGVRFTHAFATAPVCSTSRSALMTGCYQTFIGAQHHRTWPWNKRPLPPPVRHISDWFRDAGYFTCNLEPASGRPRGGSARERLTGALGSGKVDLSFRAENPFDGRDWSERVEGQPFFAHITIVETHKGEGWIIARERPRSELVDPAALKLPPYCPDHPIARDEYANYLDAIQLGDEYVGELLARLDREGLADDTIVVISSDHGPLFRGKQFLYDNGLRIPLLIRFPDGRFAGTVDDRLVSGVDVMPTLLGFAGVVPPANAVHGHDLFAEGHPERTHIVAARDRIDIAIDRMRAVRTRRYKYIRNYLPGMPYMQSNPYKEREYPTWNLVRELHRQGKLTPEAALLAAEAKPVEELYDVEADPHEVRNLAQNPAHEAALKEHRALLDAWVTDFDRATTYEDPIDVYRLTRPRPQRSR